jgi:collagen type I alpha
VTVACFASGTRLRTMSGDVAVEQLAVGDVLLTHAGIGRSIRWIGRRTIDLRGHPKPRDVQPVRVAAHAFGPRQPQRALLLSPDHAVYFDGTLIPVRYLIDGQRIVQLRRKTVTYWHVELDRHDVILAENLAVESYLDTDDRSDFAARPDFASCIWESEGCAPLTVTGPKVAAARRLGQSVAAP